MPIHVDTNDPRYVESAAEILRWHNSSQLEANITSAVWDFLIVTGLARPEAAYYSTDAHLGTLFRGPLPVVVPLATRPPYHQAEEVNRA